MLFSLSVFHSLRTSLPKDEIKGVLSAIPLEVVNLVKRAWALDQRNLVSFLSVLLDVWLWVSYGKLIGPLFPSLWSRDHNTCDPKIIVGSKRGNLRQIILKLFEASEPCPWNSICLRCSSGALLPLYWQIPPYLSEPCLCIISLHAPPLMTYCSSPISVLSAYNRKGVLGYILSIHKLHTESLSLIRTWVLISSQSWYLFLCIVTILQLNIQLSDYKTILWLP